MFKKDKDKDKDKDSLSGSSSSLAVPSSSGSLPHSGSAASLQVLEGGSTLRHVSISRASKEPSNPKAATLKSLPPIPPAEELENMFMEVVARMNVPDADKERMRAFPAEKKWQLVLDSDQQRTMLPPKHYLDLLDHHLKKRRKKKANQSAKEHESTEKDLQGMEISLRTNPLSWINEFVDPPSNGYELLSEFLDLIPEEPDFEKERYISLLCVKAVMNNKYGMTYILKRPGGIAQLVNFLIVDHDKTHILLYTLLAAVCVVGGPEGHKQVLAALDKFAVTTKEPTRFHTLVGRLANEKYNYDYKASCLSFVNVLVHVPESIHFRLYLQYEFTQLGMDGLVDTLLAANSEVLNVQLHSYSTNFISVPENYQSRGIIAIGSRALESASGDLFDSHERAELLHQQGELESKVASLQKELLDKEQAAANRISELQKQLVALQSGAGGAPTTTDPAAPSTTAASADGATGAAVPSPENAGAGESAAPEAPPPPPPPGAPPPPGPPPPPGMGAAPGSGVPGLPPKRKIQPKVPLPTLNWMAIKDPSSTMFTEIDDENFLKGYDFTSFEQRFKKNVRETKDRPSSSATMEKKKAAKEEVQVVDANRSRSMILAMKKIDMKLEDLTKAINQLDTNQLKGDLAELLLKCIPTPEEVAALVPYERQPERLAEGDRFILFLTKVDRLETKLKAIAFMDNFDEDASAVEPQLNSVIASAGSLRSSVKLKKIFEVILAFGNYMNSAKRGGAYGFKLSALDRLTDVKDSQDGHTLLLFLVEVVSRDFPAYNAFTADLLSLEAASVVSLPTITAEIQELVTGLKVLEGELQHIKGSKPLEAFFTKSSTRVTAIQTDFKNMTDLFQQTCLYFGEDPKAMEITDFFSYFLRFTRSYQTCLKDIQQRAKLAEKPKPPTGKKVRGSYAGAEKGAVDDVINEIRLKGFRR